MIRYPRGLVVGVNGTDSSRAALAFDMKEAAEMGSPLEVVTAWSGSADGGREAPEGSRQNAQLTQDRAVRRTLLETTVRPVLSRQVVEGAAGRVLIRIARNADYLVIGAGGGVEPARALGAVSDYCIRNADCAVVVVPPHPAAPANDERSMA